MSFKFWQYIIPFVLLFVVSKANAQQDTIAKSVKADGLLPSASIRLITEIGYEHDAMTASALNNAMLYASGFIDDDLKNENKARLSSLNRGGSTSDSKIFLKYYPDTLFGLPGLASYMAIEWHYLDEYRFTDDVYHLLFYGNKEFAGEKANLAYTGRNSINYFQLKAGLQKSIFKKHTFGVNLALNFGEQRNYFQFGENTCLTTNEQGTEILFKNNLSYFESDTSATDWYQISGVGAGLDLFYEYKHQGSYSLRASIENFGFIHWNKNSIQMNENKEHLFKGIEVDNVFDMPNPLVNSNDTLQDYLYANAETKSAMMLMPFDLRLEYKQFLLRRNLELSASIYYRALSYMMPLYQVDATYRLSPYFKAGPILSYGGYTDFNAGLKMQFDTKHIQIRLESRYLTGFAQHAFSGMGGFITFTYKIYKTPNL
ncbi:MAG: hypothetical protein DSY76_00735 [Bacteroidetes bacterium]|nr:MAG: hypothetical protein DSY76_00735 [Bacteroidota bacterium]